MYAIKILGNVVFFFFVDSKVAMISFLTFPSSEAKITVHFEYEMLEIKQIVTYITVKIPSCIKIVRFRTKYVCMMCPSYYFYLY